MPWAVQPGTSTDSNLVRFPTRACLTFVIALLVAIPALPLLPAMLGENVGVGRVCLDGCWALTTTNNLRDGLFSDVFFMLAPFYEPVPVLILAVGVGVWTYLVRGFQIPRSRDRSFGLRAKTMIDRRPAAHAEPPVLRSVG